MDRKRLDAINRRAVAAIGMQGTLLEHLKDYGTITQAEALAEYGCMRLGARIYDLKRKGYAIVSERAEGRNRYGETVRFARYRLDRGDRGT